jgi:hypothetical protein
MTMSGSIPFMRVVTGSINGSCNSYVPNDAAGVPTVSAVMEASDIAGLCDISAVDLSVVAADLAGTDVGLSAVGLILYISDIFNNPMPAGTTITVASNNAVLSGNTSITVGSTNRTTPISMGFVLSREGEGNKVTSGALIVTVVTPKQIITTLSIAVSDDR